jgi:hypothetical protein
VPRYLPRRSSRSARTLFTFAIHIWFRGRRMLEIALVRVAQSQTAGSSDPATAYVEGDLVTRAWIRCRSIATGETSGRGQRTFASYQLNVAGLPVAWEPSVRHHDGNIIMLRSLILFMDFIPFVHFADFTQLGVGAVVTKSWMAAVRSGTAWHCGLPRPECAYVIDSWLCGRGGRR